MTGGEPHFDRELTDAEAMMWGIERDPWLSPSGGSITLFDRPLDFDRFRRIMTNVVAEEPRFRQHVIEPRTPMTTPHWEIDHEFDLGWHVRRLRAPGAGTERDLLDWMVLFLQDPYDRTRPLWQFVVLDDVDGGRGALAVKMHHVVADGFGAVRLTSAYASLERDPPEPDEVDLDALVAGEPPDQTGVGDLVSGTMRRPLSAGRALLDALTHPSDASHDMEDLLRAAGEQMQPAGSSLWQRRSRRRHAEAVSLPFDTTRPVWKSLGGTLNDFFVTGVVEAASRYHRELGAEIERLHITFVVSTREDDDGAGNAFTPVAVDVSAGPMEPRARFAAVRDLLHAKREEVHGGGPMAAVAAVASLLPTSLVTSVARSQAGHVDVATSNLPGYLGESYVAGAKTLHTYILGPVAGTACNITLHTTAGSIDVGLHVDPAAIDQPALLKSCLEASFNDLLAAG